MIRDNFISPRLSLISFQKTRISDWIKNIVYVSTNHPFDTKQNYIFLNWILERKLFSNNANSKSIIASVSLISMQFNIFFKQKRFKYEKFYANIRIVFYKVMWFNLSMIINLSIKSNQSYVPSFYRTYKCYVRRISLLFKLTLYFMLWDM